MQVSSFCHDIFEKCLKKYVTGVDGSSAKHLTVESYTVVMPLTVILIIISFPSPTLSFIPYFPFLQILLTAAFLFLLQDGLHDSPDFYCYF